MEYCLFLFPTPLVVFACQISIRLMEANPDRAMFLLHNWPDAVSAVEALVAALLDKKRTARNVRKAMEKLCSAIAALIDPSSNRYKKDVLRNAAVVIVRVQAQEFFFFTRMMFDFLHYFGKTNSRSNVILFSDLRFQMCVLLVQAKIVSPFYLFSLKGVSHLINKR